MKHLARILSLLLVVAVGFFFTGCKDDDDKKSETDQQIEKLNGTWKASSVKYQGTDVTSDYSNFTITLTAAAGAKSIGYSTTGRPSGKLGPWTASGTLQFGAKPSTELTRDDDTAITYTVSGTSLGMDFDYSGDGHLGRIESIGGQWSFQFTKQ